MKQHEARAPVIIHQRLTMSTIVALLLCVFPVVWAEGNYFCDFGCGSKHTVCMRKNCSVGEACGPNSRALPLDDGDRRYVLDLHNEFRNMIALGRNTTGGNGEAANMQALSYDKELEYVAQCWSNACKENGKFHDACRSTKNFPTPSQNMYAIGFSKEENLRDRKYLKKAVTAWFGEIALSEANQIDNFMGKYSIQHFTAMIWADTSRVGCGRTFLTSRPGFNTIYIYCNYGEGGNVFGEPVYLRGKPCSKCGGKKCNEKYKGLCGKIEGLAQDKWKTPSN